MKSLSSRAAIVLGFCLSAPALADEPPPLKPLFDARLRVENVDQDGVPEDAHATTLRLRAGFETAKKWNTSLLVEGEGVVPIQTNYRPDPLVASRTQYPVVADPEGYEVNRFQLVNTSLPGTTVTLGRQRLLLDDQRFIGASAWRQNEQTFDALRVVNRSVKNLTVDAAYVNRVNRVYGPDSPQGHYEGDSGLLNLGYQTKAGKITAFAYLLDFENIAVAPAAVRDSTRTTGVRFAGEQPAGKAKIAYAASYAQQSDYADNPLEFDLDWKFVEVNATVGVFTIGAGAEIFEGNGVKGFTTPLATLHKFQGWADKFLTTPPNGLEDEYVTAGLNLKKVMSADVVTVVAAYHDYAAERVSADYGDEIDVSVAAKFGKVTAMLKFADFDAGVLASARDTQKVWGQVEYVW
ncbi:MAG TPA: alginate export family protein [Steroidobacteraceae bacterium]|nr:alginate export family protein [Steroidobacteraceae bacterium]